MNGRTRTIKDYSTISIDDYAMFFFLMTSCGGVIMYCVNSLYRRELSIGVDILNAIEILSMFALFTYLLTLHNRSLLQGGAGMLIGAMAYTLYLYWDVSNPLCMTFLKISASILICCAILYLSIPVRRSGSFIKRIFCRISDSFYLGRILLAIVGIIACFLIPITYNRQLPEIEMATLSTGSDVVTPIPGYSSIIKGLTQQKAGYNEVNYEKVEIYGSDYCLSQNLDRIKPLADESEWDELDLAGRQDAVIAVIECEARYQGLPFKLIIRFSDDLPFEEKGNYMHSKHLITVNNKALLAESGYKALITAMHEVRHAYQNAMTEAYAKLSPAERNLFCFSRVEGWYKNMNNYTNFEKDGITYWNQPVEVDARSSAYKEAKAYIEQINELLYIEAREKSFWGE